MEQLIREGKITYVGSSNFAGWDIATAQCTAASRNLLGLASEQSLYNLAQRTIELEVIPALRHYRVGLLPYGPLGAGLLGGVLRGAAQGRGSSLPLKRGSPSCARNWKPTKRSAMNWAKRLPSWRSRGCSTIRSSPP